MNDCLLTALTCPDPQQKCTQVLALCLADGWINTQGITSELGIPGRPAAPALVHPSQVPRRSLHTEAGRVALIHAVAHIEFNAINLALDALLRFTHLPPDYYVDWLSVAQDEARHFLLLQQRLTDLGSYYGAYAAHDGLWQAAEKTQHDVLDRMALVPRVLEARGLDVTPGMIAKLQQAKDHDTVACLNIILVEEVRHVAIGTRWLHYLCEQRGLDPHTTFIQLVNDYYGRLPSGEFNIPARLTAGFTTLELQALKEIGIKK